MDKIAETDKIKVALDAAKLLSENLRTAHSSALPLTSLMLFDLIGKAARIEHRLAEMVVLSKQ